MLAFDIYKPGQGYWTRVLSAAGAAILVLSGVYWVVTDRLAIYDFTKDWDHTISVKDQKVTQKNTAIKTWGLNLPEKQADPDNVESGVRVILRSRSPLRLAGLENNDLITQLNGKPVTNVADLLSALEGVKINQAFTIEVVRAHSINLYVQISAGLLILLASAFVLFRVFNRHNIVDFMIATEAEMKKVNWPSKSDVIGSTWVVICGTFMLALLMFVVDFIFIWLFTYIEILNAGGGAATGT
jgi:preprotein translocase SecE subunit